VAVTIPKGYYRLPARNFSPDELMESFDRLGFIDSVTEFLEKANSQKGWNRGENAIFASLLVTDLEQRAKEGGLPLVAAQKIASLGIFRHFMNPVRCLFATRGKIEINPLLFFGGIKDSGYRAAYRSASGVVNCNDSQYELFSLYKEWLETGRLESGLREKLSLDSRFREEAFAFAEELSIPELKREIAIASIFGYDEKRGAFFFSLDGETESLYEQRAVEEIARRSNEHPDLPLLLSLCNCSSFKDGEVRFLLSSLRSKIRTVQIVDCPEVSLAALAAAASKGFEEIYYENSGCRASDCNIDGSLDLLAKSCENLAYLVLDFGTEENSYDVQEQQSLLAFVEHCPNLGGFELYNSRFAPCEKDGGIFDAIEERFGKLFGNSEE